MNIDALLEEKMKNPEFVEYFNKNTDKVTIIVDLVKEREKQGLSQREIAKKTGLNPEVIERMENNFKASFKNMEKIAKVLGRRIKISIVE